MSQGIKDQSTTKVSGYLEKKYKLKIKSWKKYWFVLEGRLLLYYRSKEEYETISPCKGSINLCPPCNIVPVTNVANAFQIETRANNIILRATDRGQQEKWMQAILHVLKNHDSSIVNDKKTCIQFRYSNDDLVNSLNNNRYATPPPPTTHIDVDIVERIRSIGGQSYGGSLGAINKASESIKRRDKECRDASTTSYEDVRAKLPLKRSVSDDRATRRSVIVDNEHYVAGTEIASRKDDATVTANDSVAEKSPVTERKSTRSVLLENDQYEPAETNDEKVQYYMYIAELPDAPNNPIEIADYVTAKEPEYATTVNEDEYATAKEPLYDAYYAVGESEYDRVIVDEDAMTDRTEPEYAVPMKKRERNSLLMENDLYNLPHAHDANAKNELSVAATEALYEDLDAFGDDEYKAETSTSKKKKNSITRSLRMSASRVSKIWKRKPKKCKEPPIEADESQTSSVEVLKELQKILENKKSEIKEKMKNIDEDVVGDDDAIKAGTTRQSIEETVPNEEDPAATDNDRIEIVPQLPPHAPKLTCPIQPIYDVPTNNCPVLTKKKLKSRHRPSNVIPVKTIDEILEDLDRQEKQPSVRELIERFDERHVVMRQKTPRQYSSLSSPEDGYRHSDDLNRLLEDLAKITNAPFLTPGTTNSLNVPNTTNNEWHNLRQSRRNSDPDYDVPRSHRPPSNNLATSELLINNYVQPKRSEKDIFDRNLSESDSSTTDSDVFVSTMDPDSLEIESSYLKFASHPSFVRSISYAASCISNNNNNNDVACQIDDDLATTGKEIIYAKPRLLFAKSARTNVIKVERTESLELFKETSTIF